MKIIVLIAGLLISQLSLSTETLNFSSCTTYDSEELQAASVDISKLAVNLELQKQMGDRDGCPIQLSLPLGDGNTVVYGLFLFSKSECVYYSSNRSVGMPKLKCNKTNNASIPNSAVDHEGNKKVVPKAPNKKNKNKTKTPETSNAL